MRLFVSIPFFILMCITYVKAHGDLDLRIQAMTDAISTFPDSSELYFKRGKLRFQHEEYQSSIADINISIAKGYTNELQDIYLAKSHFRLKTYDKANYYLKLFLKEDPKNVVGLNLKGRILYAQQKYEESAICFENVIQLSIRSLPENYLEATQSWNASAHPDKYQKEVAILKLGLKNIGPIVTLQNKLIETHLQNNNKDKALAIQLEIIEKTRRKESAYFKLAEMYLELGEKANARMALYNAKTELEKLPLRIRRNAAMKTLLNKIEQLITKLIQF